MTADTWYRVKEILDACLDLEPAQWAEYLDRRCAGDAELRSEVESLLESHQQAGDFIAHPVLRESFIGLRLGHWKIVADIGEGGMSRVCLAERDDGQFQQRAAVKILKRGMDTDLILRHFQMERQILAGMRHPNVARLLDGGVTPGGRPFFVMEHIDGEPVDEYARSKRLGVAGLLRIFQQVCAATHYAHQRLVVHRDIKPSNILVTPEGVAKLLDFGIATIVSPEPALGTLTSAQMLTPAYASPEQIRGEPVTTSSDVYSLGVLLYTLLSGQNPYGSQRTPNELVQAICEQDPVAPSTVAGKEHRSALSGDLDNIILKALEKDPLRRYSSAEQLSQDVEHYLEGRPVLARAHTWTYRTSRFITRNKLAVAGAALIVLLLAGGVASTLWQARIAGIERQRAEQRFFETRQLANSLLFELHDAIQELPGSTAARALIIQSALKYLDRIAAASPGNSALQLEAAEGYKRLGDVQGRSGEANLGQYASARESYQKALALLQQPAPDPVIDRKRRRLLALTMIRLGGYQEISKALEILESVHRERAKDAATLIDLATGDGGMADLMAERRDLPLALSFRLREWSLRKQILDADSRNMPATRNYALASKKLGALLWMMNRGPEAMGYYQTALRLEEGWAELEPSSADASMAISYSHSDIGFLLSQDKKFPEALAHYRKTVEIRENLARADPQNARATLGLVSAYWRTASVAVAGGGTRDASGLLAKAEQTLIHSTNPAPGSVRSRTELAHVYAIYGESYAAAGDAGAARASYSRSKQILTGLRGSGKLDADGADLLQDVEKKLAKPEQPDK
jgi:serine/threonine protein kinase